MTRPTLRLVLPRHPIRRSDVESLEPRYYSAHINCPREENLFFSHLSRVFSHSSREKSFFFPPYDSCRSSLYTKLGEARGREEKNSHHNYFRPRPPRPDRTPSPSAAHRPESTPFAQSLPRDPIYHPPHRRRFHTTATVATRRRFHTTVDDAMPSTADAAFSWSGMARPRLTTPTPHHGYGGGATKDGGAPRAGRRRYAYRTATMVATKLNALALAAEIIAAASPRRGARIPMSASHAAAAVGDRQRISSRHLAMA